jgi:outer membrane protein OmpA-like peptidoglycan-associated protein
MNSHRRILLGTKRLPNNHAPGPKAPEEHWLLAYIKKNPFQSGVSLATLYGVLVIFAYHFHIEYFPSFDLKSLASTVFAAAYTALFFLVVFSLSLFAPAYVIGSWGLEEQAEKAEDEYALQRRIIESFAVAFVIFLIVCIVFLIVAINNLTEWILLGLPIATSICVAVVAWFIKPEGALSEKESDRGHETPRADSTIALNKDIPDPAPVHPPTGKSGEFWPALRTHIEKRKSFILTMCFVALMEALSMIIVLYMMYDTPEAKAKDLTWGVFFKLALSGAILHFIGAYLVSAWRNPAMKPAHRGFSLAAALAAPVFVASVIGTPVLFFALTAMTTKYGNFHVAEMTLTNTGCRIVENGGEHLCVKQSDGTNKLCNVHVMSRIGTETYLLVSSPGKKKAAVDAKDPAKWVLSVYVPSKEILGSWADAPERHFDKANIVTAQGNTLSVCDTVPAAAPARPSTPPAAPVPPPAVPLPPKGNGDNVERLLPTKTMFQFNKYDLTPDGIRDLQTFADGLAGKHATSMSIRILGHTDSIGQPYYNLQLSQMRAITVRNFLEAYLHDRRHEVRNLNIDFNGAGLTQPALVDGSCPGKGADEKRIDCLKPNRRAEVVATWVGGE